MINRVALTKLQPFPIILKYTDIRSYAFTLVFILLDVAVPRLFHQFNLAGPTFLPMHILILVAGLIFGWRAGLIVGLLTPLASYFVSGMPVLPILPQTLVELSSYGLVAGTLREKFKVRVIWSLLGAMAAGRLAVFLFVLVLFISAGKIYSPLGQEATPLTAVWSVIKQGWPGMLIQLVLIPVFIWLAGRLGRIAGHGKARGR